MISRITTTVTWPAFCIKETYKSLRNGVGLNILSFYPYITQLMADSLCLAFKRGVAYIVSLLISDLLTK